MGCMCYAVMLFTSHLLLMLVFLIGGGGEGGGGGSEIVLDGIQIYLFRWDVLCCHKSSLADVFFK